MARTSITDPTLPNLTDDRQGAQLVEGQLYTYSRNADGSVHVRAGYAGLGDGIGSGGRRYESLEAAAAAVRVARVKVAARWASKGWPHREIN